LTYESEVACSLVWRASAFMLGGHSSSNCVAIKVCVWLTDSLPHCA